MTLLAIDYPPFEYVIVAVAVLIGLIGKIVEFASQELERLQERIGRFLGFVVGRHRMELYGICSDCREGGRRQARPERGVHRV